MFEEEAEKTGRKLAISWVNFHFDPAVKITRQGLEAAYRAGHKDGAEFGYNEALKKVDDICTEEAIYQMWQDSAIGLTPIMKPDGSCLTLSEWEKEHIK